VGSRNLARVIETGSERRDSVHDAGTPDTKKRLTESGQPLAFVNAKDRSRLIS
jgi:hypothetical protein